MKYGMLEAVDKKVIKGRTYWLCRCDCGNEKWIRADSVKSEIQKSCGCMSKKTEKKPKDITRNRYGILTAIYNTGKKSDKGSYVWHCVCDCGNTIDVSVQDLANKSSCGCEGVKVLRENVAKAFERFSDENLFEDTSIAAIKSNKPLKSNTSGYKGVHFDKTRNKYVAQIVFKKKHYFLGRYDTAEEASKVYQEAKEELHLKFLNDIKGT